MYTLMLLRLKSFCFSVHFQFCTYYFLLSSPFLCFVLYRIAYPYCFRSVRVFGWRKHILSLRGAAMDPLLEWWDLEDSGFQLQNGWILGRQNYHYKRSWGFYKCLYHRWRKYVLTSEYWWVGCEISLDIWNSGFHCTIFW